MQTCDGRRQSLLTAEEKSMDFITRMFVRTREWHKGQTMTEYALILAAVAVVVYAGYEAMGTSITTLLSSVDSNL
jgi:Flp pilus assembly pilin Flp